MAEARLRFLYVLHLPPPRHGASLMGETQWRLELPGLEPEKTLLPISMTSDLKNLARFSWAKVFRSMALFRRIARSGRGYDLAFFSMTVEGWSLVRDAIILFLLRRRAARIMIILNDPLPAGARWRRSLLRLLFDKKWVSLLSPKLYEGNERLIPLERVLYLPNGYENSFSAEQVEAWVRERAARRAEPLRLLFAGHLAALKGLFVLLEALERVRAAGCTFQVSLMGEFLSRADRRRFEREVAGPNLAGRVKWLGYLQGQDKLFEFRRADVFVFPSLRESFGGALVEAMSAGLPAIASDTGSIPWIMVPGESGLLFPAGDSSALAAALLELAADPERRAAMGRRARQEFLARFTLEQYRDNFVDAVKTVLAGPPLP